MEKDRFYVVNNQTGKTVQVDSAAQEFRRYDLKISGVAETKKRNILAGNVGKPDTEKSLQVQFT